MIKFTATFEYLRGQKAAIITLYSNGEFSGASRISHNGEGRSALYERGYGHASTMAALKGGSLDAYRRLPSIGVAA